MPTPELQKWRDDFRAAEIGPSYSGWLHFAFTTTASLAAIVFAVSRLRAVTPAEWLLVPVFFLVANFGEYLGHRGPMHHRRAGLGLVFVRHTLQHHRFFTEETMACDSPRDFKIMLFPPVMVLFFIGGMALPIGAVLYFLLSANAAWLFAAVAIGYFLTYEWLHFLYHLPEEGLAARLPFLAALRRHHQKHHDPRLMADWNFNITFPIADVLLGTRYRGPRSG